MNARKDLLLWFSVFSKALCVDSFSADPKHLERFTPAEPNTLQELFGQTIRASLHRNPREELAGFHVPEGFQVDLIAAEPTIAKPMNMAFDATGRLWITQSTQYPFPAKADQKGRDASSVAGVLSLCEKQAALSDSTKTLGNGQLISWFGRSAKGDDRRDWLPEKRELSKSLNGVVKRGLFFSSRTLGESYSGTWSSSPSVVPPGLGHSIFFNSGGFTTG